MFPLLTEIFQCIRFVATYGLFTEGIYRRNGKVTEAKEIMKQLTSGWFFSFFFLMFDKIIDYRLSQPLEVAGV